MPLQNTTNLKQLSTTLAQVNNDYLYYPGPIQCILFADKFYTGEQMILEYKYYYNEGSWQEYSWLTDSEVTTLGWNLDNEGAWSNEGQLSQIGSWRCGSEAQFFARGTSLDGQATDVAIEGAGFERMEMESSLETPFNPTELKFMSVDDQVPAALLYSELVGSGNTGYLVYRDENNQSTVMIENEVMSARIPEGYVLRMELNNGEELYFWPPGWFGPIDLSDDGINPRDYYSLQLVEPPKMARGEWVLVQGGMQGSYDFQDTLIYDESLFNNAEEAYESLHRELGIGIKYEGWMQNDFQRDQYMRDLKNLWRGQGQLQQSCSNGANNEPAGLWAWQITNEDQTIMFRPPFGECKYGNDWNQSPSLAFYE